MKFLLKLFPEIIIKSPAVRREQTRQLQQNIRRILTRLDAGIEVTGTWDRIEVLVPDDNASLVALVGDALQRIPGIDQILEVHTHVFRDFDDVLMNVARIYLPMLVGKSFAVRVRRQGKHAFSSQELERFLGAGLMRMGEASGVDLRQPEVTVRVELKGDRLEVVQRNLPGLGGYPLGSQSSVVSLLSGGFDSAVAAYLVMKRGMRSHFLFFNLGGVPHEIGVRQMALHLWQQYASSHRMRFVSVPFDRVLAELALHVPPALRGVVLKRLMLRAAQQVAENLNSAALVTGECVAQVSSQTLPNLNVIDRACDMLVLRPLITSDKESIIRLAREIGTEELARHMPEYCGAVSGKVTVCAKSERVEHAESRLSADLLAEALARREVLFVEDLAGSCQRLGVVEEVAVPAAGEVVIDIRHPDQQSQSPLVLPNNPVRAIPFYELQAHQDELAALPACLLYCAQGSMSQLHAAHLQAAGLNVRVFKPVGAE